MQGVSQTLDRGRQSEYRSIAQRKHSSDRLRPMYATTGLAMRRTLGTDQPELRTAERSRHDELLVLEQSVPAVDGGPVSEQTKHVRARMPCCKEVEQ